MPDPIDISDLPEYGPALAKYRADKAQAAEQGSEVDQANVEAAWANTRMNLVQTKAARENETRQLEAARGQLKTEFPNVPEEVYSHLTDVDQARAAAAKVAERLAPITPPAGEGQQPPAGESWGGTPGSVGGGATGGEPPVEAPEQIVERLAPVVLSKGKGAMLENAQLRKAALAPILDRYEPGKAAR